MDTELARARFAKLEEEIAAFERWQEDKLDRRTCNAEGVQAMEDNRKTPAEFDPRTPAEWHDTGVGLAVAARDGETPGKAEESEVELLKASANYSLSSSSTGSEEEECRVPE
ncbi:MAG TPA: hypothetical protein VKM93_00465 [Terriglobia bacterium]|nr:hypothetical protein [Terriglobia bacterium]